MVQVIKKGILTTLQTLPRSGWRSYGVSPRGPMDIYAHAMVNHLLGNGSHAAVMELHFPAGLLQFMNPCCFALAGGDFGAVLNNIPLLPWQVQEAGPCDLLRFTGIKKGFRAYLGIQGGFDIPLSSYDNYQVQAGENIPFGQWQPGQEAATHWAGHEGVYATADCIGCMAAPEYDWLSEVGKALLETAAFTISPAGNRMGLPLLGAALQREREGELLSGAVAMGTVQLLPNGQCMVLMADHNTTGGYPRIATVLASELPKLAQLRPGQIFRFKLVAPQDAAQQYLRFVQQLNIQTWR